MNIMQGDQYNLVFDLTIDDSEIDISIIDKIQFKVGDLLKSYSQEGGEVTFDATQKLFYFPLSQEETFKFDNNSVYCEIRIKFKSGIIKGTKIGGIRIDFSAIKENLWI